MAPFQFTEATSTTPPTKAQFSRRAAKSRVRSRASARVPRVNLLIDVGGPDVFGNRRIERRDAPLTLDLVRAKRVSIAVVPCDEVAELALVEEVGSAAYGGVDGTVERCTLEYRLNPWSSCWNDWPMATRWPASAGSRWPLVTSPMIWWTTLGWSRVPSSNPSQSRLPPA